MLRKQLPQICKLKKKTYSHPTNHVAYHFKNELLYLLSLEIKQTQRCQVTDGHYSFVLWRPYRTMRN